MQNCLALRYGHWTALAQQRCIDVDVCAPLPSMEIFQALQPTEKVYKYYKGRSGALEVEVGNIPRLQANT